MWKPQRHRNAKLICSKKGKALRQTIVDGKNIFCAWNRGDTAQTVSIKWLATSLSAASESVSDGRPVRSAISIRLVTPSA